MNISSRRRGASLLAGLFAVSFTALAQAQVLDAPDFYSLPPQNPNQLSEQGLPATMSVGEIDTSVVTDIGNVPLNDVVVLGVPVEVTPQGGEPLNGRVWTLIHTSGSDTQALQVLTPVDIAISTDDPEGCYEFPSSVQILDLNGDDQNDLAFSGPNCFEIEKGFSDTAQVFGLQGNTSDPFQDNASLTVLGEQASGFGIPDPLFEQVQPVLTSADLTGDGLIDLAFPDNLTQGEPANLVHSLLNDGTLAALNFELSTVTGPFTGADANDSAGVAIVAGDFDGNGTQDVAIAYFVDAGLGDVNEVFVYSGQGDGSFAQEPLAQVEIASNDDGDLAPGSIVSGDFNNDNFSDFAVSYRNLTTGDSFIAVLTCSPGQPASCQVAQIPAGTAGSNNASNLAAADFNNDGLDDLVNVFNTPGLQQGEQAFNAVVQIRLNNGGQFDNSADQTLALNTPGFPESLIPQVIAQDIDACGGPDLAYMGVVFDQENKGAGPFDYQAAVAFNPNEAPIANAGSPVQSGSGFQVGGVPGGEPTCSDPTDDLMVISWTVLSGEASISDPTAANPIVTGSGEVTVQVTCTDACGLSDTDTVTIPAAGFIQGSCGTSLTGTMSAGFNATWLAIPALMGMLGMLRRRKA